MSGAHRIDKARVIESLAKKGVIEGSFNSWLMPSSMSSKDYEQAWTEAILEGIICEHEENSRT